MTKLTMALAPLLVAAVYFTAPSPAQDDEALRKDLTAVIALHGMPCGQVVAVTVQAKDDYLASCRDGNRYRVYLNAEGRVVVEKRT
jgi:hypothetical protein